MTGRRKREGKPSLSRRKGVTIGEGDTSPVIPDKLFFRIGEVARLTGVRPYVLRYWQSEFSVLTPQKSPTGQRLYRREDLLTILRIKDLLYREGYTIAGAKKRLAEERMVASPGAADVLKRIKEELLAISSVLSR
ncbi:MAG: MerR family transcriptional regulator [candidate division NC10 bacterium]|nr:MerR family transcriptional regulator [candidate division NC10 bacterium]